MDLKPNILIVSGPTACGKSALALRLAKDLGGEIVNIDSVQLFRGFDIGSAKPSVEEQKVVPHHLFDVLEGDEQSNAQDYVQRADLVIADIVKRGRLPILVGGTTLYITALLHGLVSAPVGSLQLRTSINQRPLADCYAELQGLDPVRAADLHPNDSARIRRALELCLVTGAKASDLKRDHGHLENRYHALIIVPIWSREELYERINRRSEQLIGAGIVRETKELLDRFGGEAHGLRSVGYAECLTRLEGQLPDRSLVEAIAQSTRRLAKRQLTYWRNEPDKRGWKRREMRLDYANLLESLSGLPEAGNEVWYVPVSSYTAADLGI